MNEKQEAEHRIQESEENLLVFILTPEFCVLYSAFVV